MSERYFVTAVRKSEGLYTDEGKYLDETAAIVRLAELGEDPDCLIAEITELSDSSAPQSDIVVAQSERLHGEWLRIEGELRIRTRGGEAEGILRANKVSEIMTESNKLKAIVEQELEARIKAGGAVDCLAIASLYEGSYSLSLSEIQSLVREVGRAKGVNVVG